MRVTIESSGPKAFSAINHTWVIKWRASARLIYLNFLEKIPTNSALLANTTRVPPPNYLRGALIRFEFSRAYHLFNSHKKKKREAGEFVIRGEGGNLWPIDIASGEINYLSRGESNTIFYNLK